MDTLAVGIAAVALFVALLAWRRAASFAGRIEEAELAARRRVENLGEGLEQALAAQRELLARVAGGERLTREMILEGRLWRDVDGREARELVAGGARVLDVRTPGECASGIVPGAQLIPIESLEARVGELARDGRPWVVYCAAGGRSAAACEFLSAAGHSGLHNLAGGIGAWGGELVRPK